MPAITLYTSNVLAKYVLIYSYEKFPEHMQHIEYLYDNEVPDFDMVFNREMRKNIKIITPSDGTFLLPWKKKGGWRDSKEDGETRILQLIVQSTYTEDQAMIHNREREIIKKVTLKTMGSILGSGPLQPTTEETDKQAHGITREDLIDFIDEAKDYVEKILSNHLDKNQGTISKYLFQEKWDWQLLSLCPKRSVDSIFIDVDQKKELVDLVKDFVTPATRDEYHRFSIPYKLNIMLHGKQGTGKTSTVHSIASLINANLYILQFPKWLDDGMLARAFNSIPGNHAHDNPTRKNCVILMEDIDCIFQNRKEYDTARNSVTLSGLLNVLDGMIRPDGVIVFMTTNNIDAIDAAMLRPGRMDMRIKYHEPSKENIRDMFSYILPHQMQHFEAFYNFIQYKNVSTSLLQEFLFRYRKSECICDHLGYLLQIDKDGNHYNDASSKRGKEGHDGEDTAMTHMYM